MIVSHHTTFKEINLRNLLPLRLLLAMALPIGATHTFARADSPPASAPAPAAPASAPTTAPAASPPPSPAAPGDKLSTTEHELTINGQSLRYRATAGRMVVRDEAEKPKAEFFFVSYEKLPLADNPATRPITYVFNGGPGAAAVWLHVGTAGPQRIALNENGDPPAPPFHLEDNPETWLGATDLVFIDPVGTGFSRAAQGEKPEQFYGVEEDVQSVGEFIRLYTTRYQRWASPKFLAGESYGTTRAAALAGHLIDDVGIDINGIVLISSVLSFQTIQPGGANELPFALYVPSYAAIAWYHKKLAPDLQNDLQATIAQAEKWTIETYMPALSQGGNLPVDQRKQIAAQLSRFTGLPADYIERSDLRIEPSRFEKELLASARQIIGRFDGRITGYSQDAAGAWPEFDPSLSGYYSVYASTFNDYVRRVLHYDSDLTYEVLSGKGGWNFGRGGSGYLDVAHNLSETMVKHPHLKVMFANGYFDLATPFATANYTIDHLDLSPALRGNVTHLFYEGGHMMYHYRPSLKKLNGDVTQFITSSATPGLQPTTRPAK